MDRKVETDDAKNQSWAQFESIREMVENLKAAEKSGDNTAFDEAETMIHEDPLSVEVRSDWYTLDQADGVKASEFRILLCTGGPACQIVGELDEHLTPVRASIQYQDWGTPWTPYGLNDEEREVLVAYCQRFHFGE